MEAMEVDVGDCDFDNSSEKLFVFHESVPTLRNIANHTVALQLWHHYFTRSNCEELLQKTSDYSLYDRENEGYLLVQISKNSVKILRTPRNIEEMLETSLYKICRETNQWISHFKKEVFTDGFSRYYLRGIDPNHIIWRQNDEIDYKRSASNILMEENLNAEQKFVLMSSYGMADELERFPMDSLSGFFHLLGITDLRVAYWISYHRDDLREIWLRMPGMVRNENTSINVTMAMEYANRSFPYAFEYFWNRLSEDEQISVAVRILPQSSALQKTILSTMSSAQQRRLVDRIPVELMSNFFVNCDMPENAFKIWTRVKDRITEQQFSQFLNNIFNDDAMYIDKCVIALNNIWDTASDRLKRHMTESDPAIIFNAFMCCGPVPADSYRFFMKFLPMVNEHTRKELISSVNVYILAQRPDIDILNLCLPKEADQLRFKNQIMESRVMLDYCVDALNDMAFDEVITGVTFFSENARVAREFYTSLLESGLFLAEAFILQYDKWNELSNFIDTVFTGDVLTVSRLKKHLVSSFSTRAVHCWDKNENIDVLVKITEQVFSNEEMKTLKRTLLKRFQKMISSWKSWRDLKGKCFNTFVSWCLNEESRIVDFKSIVWIDAFFDRVFRTICSSSADINSKNCLNELDEFLRYFCADDEDVELFKMRKYYECDRYWIRRVERNFHDDTRRQILNWFLSIE